jgi:hypothetical protein
MNPQFNQSQGLHLPQPASQPSGLPPAMPNHGVPQAPPVAQPVAPAPLNPNPSITAPAPAQAVATQDGAGALLDEEWVAKAKEVVAHTALDPYAQSRGLAQVKAQYLKARYNKDIKTGKDSSK